MDLKTRAKKLKSDIPIIFLALEDKDTPIVAKIFAGITVVYAFSPIDLVPDFIPVLGYLDDVILLPMLVLCNPYCNNMDYYSRSALESNSVSEDRSFLY